MKKKGHASRAAINTPIQVRGLRHLSRELDIRYHGLLTSVFTLLGYMQGSAADVASSAMVAIERCPKLKELGYKLIMQVRLSEHGPHQRSVAWSCMSIQL
jgi:DNA polymerase-1